MKRKRVMMVVFEFPPSNGASVQRIISVYNGFLKAGWDVDVITAKPHAYPNIQDLPDGLLLDNPHGKIIRTTALDVMRHLSLGGKHFGAMVRPDRWGMTWIPSAIFAGKSRLKKCPPDLIWSSSPTPSPHVIAGRLADLSGASWIADYRDPMPYMHGRGTGYLDKQHRKIDGSVRAGANLLTFATPGIRDLYVEHFQPLSVEGFKVMENGYDDYLMQKTRCEMREGSFNTPFSAGKLSLYYAGVLYEDGRDPVPIFEALAKLIKENPSINKDNVELIFQGASMSKTHKYALETLGIEEVVKFIEPVPFTVSLRNMLSADALVLIQDQKFNNQVPGKLYEYLASEKPLLLKTPEISQTYSVARNYEGVWRGDEKTSLFDALCGIVSVHCDEEKKLINKKNLISYRRNVSGHSRQHHVEKMIMEAEAIVASPENKAWMTVAQGA